MNRPDLEAIVSPFPPGESPYKVKGIAYKGHIEYVDAHVRGGSRAMIDGMATPALQAFWGQPFLASTFYDIFPLAQSGAVCARLCGEPVRGYLDKRGRTQARSDIKGIYRLLLKLVSAEAVATRLPKFRQQYFSYGSMRAEVVAPRHVKGQSSGVPEPIIHWSTAVIVPYFETVLELTGAKEPKVAFQPPVRRGPDEHGVELVDIAYDLRWH